MNYGATLMCVNVPASLTFSDPNRLRTNIILIPMRMRMFMDDYVQMENEEAFVDIRPFLKALKQGDTQAVGTCLFAEHGYHPAIPPVADLLTKDFTLNLLHQSKRKNSIWGLAQVNAILEKGVFDLEIELSTNWPSMSVKEMKEAYAQMAVRVNNAKGFPEPMTNEQIEAAEITIRKDFSGQFNCLEKIK